MSPLLITRSSPSTMVWMRKIVVAPMPTMAAATIVYLRHYKYTYNDVPRPATATITNEHTNTRTMIHLYFIVTTFPIPLVTVAAAAAATYNVPLPTTERMYNDVPTIDLLIVLLQIQQSIRWN